MLEKIVPYIFILLLGMAVVFQHFTKPTGISPMEILLMEKVKEQSQDIIIMRKARNQDIIKVKQFIHEDFKNDTIIGGYTDSQLDSFMSDFDKR